MSWVQVMAAARRGTGPLRHARTLLRRLLTVRVPVVRPLAAFLYAERSIRAVAWPLLLKILYREPLLRYRCARVGERLWLEGQLPQIGGDGVISIGNDVRIGGRNSWLVGFKNSIGAEIVIGDRVNIGYQNVLSAAKSIRIGDDTMFAPNVHIYDNPTHPLHPLARLRHESAPLEDARPVVIGRNVWIGTGAMVMRGVTIGDGAVVGAMAVVTRDVPPACLAAGNPARVVRQLDA